MNKKTLSTLITNTAAALERAYKNKNLCKQYALWMLQAITGKTELQLIMQGSFTLTPSQEKKLQKWIDAQVNHHEPLQYLLGSVPFGDLEILVEPPILIPRPETEEWCMILLEHLAKLKNKKLLILDVCTGTGCIALTLAHALPQSSVVATDIDERAIALCKKNAKHNGISNTTCIKSDLFTKIPKTKKFDFIISNPPYIPLDEWKTLDASVKEWETKTALVADDNGLALIKEIIEQAPEYLKENSELKEKQIPQLMIEIGYQQGPAVFEYFKKCGYTNVVVHKDLEGKDRIVSGRVS
jgi:release factor glutamine methyltransferase